MKIPILIIGSFLIGIFILNYLRNNFDIHEKEPLGKMVLVTLLGGSAAIVLSLVTYAFLARHGVQNPLRGLGPVFVIGPVEEASKLAGLFLCYLLIRKDLNEPTDGLIYMGCVALGFSLIENIQYALSTTDPTRVMAMRLTIATPMHISFSLFMGLAFYALIKLRSGWLLLALSFSYAFVMHGLYDLAVFHNLLLLALFLIIKTAHSWSLELVGYTTAISPYRVSLSDFIASYPSPDKETGIECLACGDTGDKATYKHGHIVIQKCSGCTNYVTTLDSLFYMFHHFGSTFRDLKHHFVPGDSGKGRLATLYKGNHVNETRKIAYFDLEELNAVLEGFTREIVQGMKAFVRSSLESEQSLADLVTPELAAGATDSETTATNGRIRKVRPGLITYLLYPFDGPHTLKQIHIPQEQGPVWCWGAFIVPEFWFLWQEILGAGFAAIGGELLLIRVFAGYFGFNGFIFALLVTRTVAALVAPKLYYYRYGHWHGDHPT